MGDETPKFHFDAPSSGTSLLDLGDDLLLKILDHLHDAPAIGSLGAVNKRLNKLDFPVKRLTASITTRDPGSTHSLSLILRVLQGEEVPGPWETRWLIRSKAQRIMECVEKFQSNQQLLQRRGVHLKQASPLDALRWCIRSHPKRFTEAHLESLLLALARKGGGLLRKLSVSIDEDFQQLSVFCRARLDWIKIVSSSLQSLELAFFSTRASAETFFSDLACCGKLVSLDLTCGDDFIVIGRQLARLVASCPVLKKLSITLAKYFDHDVVSFTSNSLEELSLHLWVLEGAFISLCLETPALRCLATTLLYMGKLQLRSHALRTLKMEALGQFSFETPLADLEVLSTGVDWSREALEQAMGGLTSRRLETLAVSDKNLSVTELPEMIARHLSKVEKLVICLQGSAPTLDDAAGVCGVEVEEIEVMAVKMHASEGDQYEHLYNSVVLLRKYFPSVHRILVADGHLFDEERDEDSRPTDGTFRRALDDLMREFPGMVSQASSSQILKFAIC